MEDKVADRVTEFVAHHWAVPVSRLTPSTRLEDDLGMTRDDAAEFVQAFAAEFGVNLSGIEADKRSNHRGFGWRAPARVGGTRLAK